MSIVDDIESALKKAAAEVGAAVEGAAHEVADFLKADFRVPLERLGIENLPALPFNVLDSIETLHGLLARKANVVALRRHFSTPYTIGGQSGPGRLFLYGDGPEPDPGPLIAWLKGELAEIAGQPSVEAARSAALQLIRQGGPPGGSGGAAAAITALPLDEPAQFEIGWTTYAGIYDACRPRAEAYAGALSDPESATEQFWPTIATDTGAYNLLILRKVSEADLAGVRRAFGDAWTDALTASAGRAELFFIDLRMFGSSSPVQGGAPLFTPATATLLWRDPATKALRPVAVSVGGDGLATRIYTRRPAGAPLFAEGSDAARGAWIYALEAVRTSVSIWGIVIGHVYHYHMAAAALFMTMKQELPAGHPLRQVIEPFSKHVTGFDDVLLILWANVVPPMSIPSGLDMLRLADRYASGRTFWDDDPTTTLENMGIAVGDFTAATPWDRYPVASNLLDVWGATGDYAAAVVRQLYPREGDVAADAALQSWIAASADPRNGNIVGLGPVQTAPALSRFLQSLLYRVIMHGVSSINQTAFPGLAFASNFPTCLNGTDMPAPGEDLPVARLLARLPHTGQIGAVLGFYSTFVFSPPYEPFLADIPAEGPLRTYKEAIKGFVERFQTLKLKDAPQPMQWPTCIEL